MYNLRNQWYLWQFSSLRFVTVLPPTKVVWRTGTSSTSITWKWKREAMFTQKQKQFTNKRYSKDIRYVWVSERELIRILHPDRPKGAENHIRRDYKRIPLKDIKDRREVRVFTTKLSESCQKVLNTANVCSLLILDNKSNWLGIWLRNADYVCRKLRSQWII